MSGSVLRAKGTKVNKTLLSRSLQYVGMTNNSKIICEILSSKCTESPSRVLVQLGVKGRLPIEDDA